MAVLPGTNSYPFIESKGGATRQLNEPNTNNTCSLCISYFIVMYLQIYKYVISEKKNDPKIISTFWT